MSIGVIAALVVVALVGAALILALPRLRGRSRPASPGPRRSPAVADETVIRDEPVRPHAQPTLISEGEAIREQVEARLRHERSVRAPAVEPARHARGDDLARLVEHEQRERYPSTYGAPGYAPVDGAVVPPAGVLAARDQLAWQIEQDERRRFPDAYPPSRPGLAGPIGGGLQPQMLPVSDALELQLQEIALRSRTQIPPAPRPAGADRRRRSGFGRARRPAAVDGDREGQHLAP